MINKIFGLMLLIIMLFPLSLDARIKDLAKEKQAALKPSILEISDRAMGVHDASNIGLYFTNYGRISRGTFASRYAGEYPINSDHNYIWKLMPLVGVAPDQTSGRAANVIQSVYLSNIEWEAVPDYHNPAQTSIAFSDDPTTWPDSVWFFHDDQDNPLFVSNQDSYCAYNDANNSVEVLGIQINKTGYAFANSDYKNMVCFKFEITNQSFESYDSVYFGFHQDFDIGGSSEYADDLLGWDSGNDFIYTYDADDYSATWDSQPGVMGIVMLETPLIDGSMAGITDMHYGRLDLDDSTLIATLSSNLNLLPAGVSPAHFFNTGSSPDLHFDDPGLIPPSGADIYGSISSGPYDLSPVDTLTFVIGIIAGINVEDLYKNLHVAQGLYANNFEAPKPPAAPPLAGVASHNKVTLYWTNTTEDDFDELSGARDFEGYRLYKSLDRGLTWDQLDRNLVPDIGFDPVPFASFDRLNGWGDDAGLQYTYIDSPLIDGIEYWYSITAFDHGDSLLESLESPIGTSTAVQNVLSLIPVSASSDYESGEVSGLIHYGPGNSNYDLSVTSPAPQQLSNYIYDLHFLYGLQNEIGNPGIWATIEITDSSEVPTIHYGIEFTAVDRIDILNIDSRTVYWSGPMAIGYPYPFGDGFTIYFHQADTSNSPSAGDLISLNFCAEMLRYDGQDTLVVIPLQRFDPGKNLVSNDGLIISLDPRPAIQNISVPPILGFEIEFEVADLDSIEDLDYVITVVNSGMDTEHNTFLVIKTTDENGSILGAADTVYNGWEIQYGGWSALFGFDSGNPPPPGSTATLATLAPIRPTIQDGYQFGMVDGGTNPEKLEQELSQIRVVPNPYLAGSLWESNYGSYRREPIRQIQFINLPMACEINIFTLSGDLIKTLEHSAAHGTETWDLRAEGGREIVSGIYLYQVKSAGFEFLNRFAVIK